MEELQNKIRQYVTNKYKGSLRFLKEKMFKAVFGNNAYNHVIDFTKCIDNIPFSLRIYHFLHNLSEVPKCKCCDKHVKFNTSKGEYAIYCSNSCRLKDIDNIQEIKRNTNLKRYGATNVLASSYGKEKARLTHRQKYGKDHYNQTQEYKDRVKSGNIVRSFNPKLTRESLYKTYYQHLLNHPLIIPKFSFEEYKGVNHFYKVECRKCSTEYQWRLFRALTENSCPVCAGKGTKIERQLREFLTRYNIEYFERHRKSFNNEYELDIFIKNKNIGIELNGLYWHCDKIVKDDYHLNKLNFFESQGIKLIQIFEDELRYKPKIVFSRLKHILSIKRRKIYARKCEVREITTNVKNSFLEKYHIQGSCSSKINLGLYYKDRLVAVMTFGSNRIVTGSVTQSNEYELLRYATIFNFIIVGGASKLFKYFIRRYNPIKVVSYADRRWSSGNLYYQLGFTFIRNTPPNYWYTKNYLIREHRFNYRKDKLAELLENFNSQLSERENMKNHGYSRIYDCGSMRFEWIS